MTVTGVVWTLAAMVDEQNHEQQEEQRPHEPESEPEREPPGPPTPYAFVAPEGFEKVTQDFMIYSPDHSDGRACFGILWDAIDLPRQMSTIKALVVILIEPTPVVDADGRVYEARPGQEVLVEVTHYLRRLLRAAIDPKSVGEIWLRCVGKLPASGGDSIPLWDIKGGKVYPREKFRKGGR